MDQSLNNRQPLHGLLAFDDDCVLTDFNATAAQWLGYDGRDLLGRRLDLLLEPGGWLYVQSQLLPTLKLQGWLEEVYLNFRESSGARMPMLINARRTARDGREQNEFGFLRMRQRARMEQEFLEARKLAEQASDAKSKFLAMMSHELRTPLQTISLNVDMLLQGEFGVVAEAQQAPLIASQSATADVVDLIDDILNFARMRSGELRIASDVVPFADALNRAEVLLMARFSQAGLQYERECLEPGLAVRCDRKRLQQILLNLLSNSLKFTPPGGKVRTSCRRTDGWGQIDVSDTGPGIPGDQQQRIFEPFVQLTSPIQSHQKNGLGLGLAICRELAQAMGGKLEVRSKVGQGTTFTLLLPLAC